MPSMITREGRCSIICATVAINEISLPNLRIERVVKYLPTCSVESPAISAIVLCIFAAL